MESSSFLEIRGPYCGVMDHFLGAKSAEPHGALSGADDGHEHVADVFSIKLHH